MNAVASGGAPAHDDNVVTAAVQGLHGWVAPVSRSWVGQLGSRAAVIHKVGMPATIAA
jgi:hypothetical protein